MDILRKWGRLLCWYYAISSIHTCVLINANACNCELGKEKTQSQEDRLVLQYPKQCHCGTVSLGGMNTWTPKRPFIPVYATDIDAIREKYEPECEAEAKTQGTATSQQSELLSTADDVVKSSENGVSTSSSFQVTSATEVSTNTVVTSAEAPSSTTQSLSTTTSQYSALVDDTSQSTEHVRSTSITTQVMSESSTSNHCQYLGTSDYPAHSCMQIKEECNASSGLYYLQHTQGAEPYQVYCDMESFDGGWTRFGKSDQQWNYVHENFETTTIDVISDADVLTMQNLHFTEFRVLTDVTFRLQQDDSFNPSLLSVTLLPSLSNGKVELIGNFDHTRILWKQDDPMVIECYADGGSSGCNLGGTPPVRAKGGICQPPMFVRSAFFGPRAPNATASDDEWRRNKYTWSGSYYYVLARYQEQPVPTTRSPCEIGTASHPALSCLQIRRACQAPSGLYYLQAGVTPYIQVYCDMESFGGGWARFGKVDMCKQWNYVNEDMETTTFDIISDSDVLTMQSMNYTEFRVLTNVQFRLQHDGSSNPSSLSVTVLPSLANREMKLVGTSDHTRLVFKQGDPMYIECVAGSTTSCNLGGMPPAGAQGGICQPPMFIRSVFFGPRESDATASNDEWWRNKYTWSGSYYYVLASAQTPSFESSISTACEIGTINYPAHSCMKIKEVCQAPSGLYYLDSYKGNPSYLQIYCDMESFDGGWARFGKADMCQQWNYVNEDNKTTTIDVISNDDLLTLQQLSFTEFKILTNVQLWLQADNSVNPSDLSVMYLPSLAQGEISIDGYTDHTRLQFVEQGNYIQCFNTSTPHRCGHGGAPQVGVRSEQLLIRSATFGPRAPGATTENNQWGRNKYTWSGSYYYVLAKK